MFASINLDGATESAGKQVLTRDGIAVAASPIEIIPAITAPDVRRHARSRSFQAGGALHPTGTGRESPLFSALFCFRVFGAGEVPRHFKHHSNRRKPALAGNGSNPVDRLSKLKRFLGSPPLP